MWIGLALLSALMLGLYDVAKKRSLEDNAVLPVLLCSTALSSLLFLPFIISSEFGLGWFDGTLFDFPRSDARTQTLYIIKGLIVASTWTFGYYGLKHLPLTIAGPINASRPVLVLLGSILLFGERLNALQWIGVGVAFVSFYLLSRSSRKEGIDFAHNRWIACMVAAMVIGVISALYDKYLMRSLSSVAVQGWSNIYITVVLTAVTAVLWLPRRKRSPFRWRWSIVLIALFISLADFTYFYALTVEGSMLSVISLVRRSSVVVSFLCGALLFREKNLRSKAVDLVLLLTGLAFLLLGTL